MDIIENTEKHEDTQGYSPKNKLLGEATDFSIASVKHIIDNFGKREPGSKAEKDAEEYLMNQAKNNGWADEIKYEEFEVAPKAFMGFTRVIPILIAISWVLFLVSPAATLVCIAAALAVIVLQFLMYKEFLDPFYKKATSTNAFAVKKATGVTKRRIYIEAHPDAAYEWSLFYKYGMLGHASGPVFAIVGVVLTVAISIASFVLNGLRPPVLSDYWWFIFIPLISSPGLILFPMFTNYNHIVDGANDNLSGCAAVVATLKYLSESGVSFENTEVVAMLAGSEESGLRGAKAFCREHAAEIKAGEVETMFLVVDTLRDYEHFYIYEKDLSGTLRHNPKAVALLDKATVNTGRWDKPLKHSSVYTGASNAAAYTQAGLIAGALAGMDPAPPRYYHTRGDVAEILVPKSIEAGIDIIVEAINEFDKVGL